MLLAKLPKRGTDAWGSGEFGASRGSRTHNGIDYACYPETPVYSLTDGLVTKLGYPYGDDLSFRYVEVESKGLKHRYFYVEPSVKVGDVVNRLDLLGYAQDIAGRYDKPGKIMKNHVHYEIKEGSKFLDPEVYHGVV